MLATSFTADTAGVRETAQAGTQFSYDAVDDRNKRKSPAVKHGAEDLILDPSKRSKLNANSSDIRRNYAVAAWMIRKHLDYVSTFDFHSRDADGDRADETERLMAEWSRPHNCDAAARHPLAKILRLAEAERTIHGDIGILKLASGQIQGIEADRVRDPTGHGAFMPGEPKDGSRWIHGVKVNEAGRSLAYAIHKRTGLNSYEFERSVSASRMCWFGYYDRFDQVRGVSPLASALNDLRDTYEAKDYALLKAKVVNLFALAFYREATEAAGELSGGTDADGNEEKSEYSVDFGSGPVKLDLNPGDRAEFLESKHPSTEFQAFLQVAINIALKALDLPYSFWDESYTNFFGSRAAWLHYQRSCIDKWNDAIELRRKLTVWRLSLWILDGTLKLKKSETIADLAFEWVPRGMPWWDPTKEINGSVQEIKIGVNTPQRVCRERGSGDWYDNVDQIAEAIDYAKKRKVPLDFAMQPPPAVEVVEREDT